MVLATQQALTTALESPLSAVPRVSAAAARSRSTTPAAVPGKAGAVLVEPAVPAHRQQSAPTRKQGRSR
ncbi:hypothetical protein [Streptomyces sp. NPDC054961]